MSPLGFGRRMRQHSMRVPRWLRGSLVAVAVALGGYWSWSQTGLFRALAAAQLQSWGSYDVNYTALFTILACLVVAAIVVQIIARFMRPRPDIDPEADHARQQRTSRWLLSHRFRLLGAGLAVAFAVTGGYYLIRAAAVGPRTRIDIGELEAGAAPPSRFVDLHGRLLWDESIAYQSRSATKTVVPVVSERWRRGQPVAVFVELSSWVAERHASELAAGELYGLLETGGLPAIASTGFENRGTKVADATWMLDYRETPAASQKRGTELMGIAGFFALVTAVAWAVMARRKRPNWS